MPPTEEPPSMSDAEYEPSTWDWVADQVAEYEASGGTQANTLRDSGIPIIVVTCVGHKSGKVRKVPLMRVEKDGEYAIIASKGGRPEHPGWYHNLLADPNVQIQDGPSPEEFVVRELSGDERAGWYVRGEAVYPPYTDYAVSAGEHGREIPVFVATPVD
jgi:deazaflavin-dependent oxidoreductase (nitroreductase family)